MSSDDHGGPRSKRQKLELDMATEAGCTPSPSASDAIVGEAGRPFSLDRPVSPPASRRTRSHTPQPSPPRVHLQTEGHVTKQTTDRKDPRTPAYVRSPIQLTKIRDLATHQNVDTVELTDILGDPMIKECWNFNFLFDLDFVMNHFDADVKDMVNVKIVHGFWKNEDERRLCMMEVAERYPKVELISAYMPDPFGTHHSKMLILFRHDDSAQVVIHTANMIRRDWGNMTQAVWRSPLLALQSTSSVPLDGLAHSDTHAIGSGERFKKDLLAYLRAYGKRLKGLTEQLVHYDFSTVRAAFVGSAPSRQKPKDANPSAQTSFGWLGLKETMSTIPVRNTAAATPPNIVVQVSSIATLGPNPTWIKHFQSVLSRTASTRSSSASSFFPKASSMPSSSTKTPDPTLNIIFPTASEIRTSLDGYDSGGSIHTKVQSPAQQKQLEYLLPLLCHWKYSLSDSSPSVRREAFRGPAAPHIKTYIRFTDAERKTIDWAMVTSANMSKQAWGEVENKKEEIWIQSWETGVVVWPALYGEGDEAVMVPVFGRDMPRDEDVAAVIEGKAEDGDAGSKGSRKTIVGFRMPYDLPLSPYGPDEVPWCASLADDEQDWMGRVWKGY